MLRKLSQYRSDALLGRQAHEVAEALHQLATEGGHNAIDSQIYRINQLPNSTPEERLRTMSSLISRKVANAPYKIHAVTQHNGNFIFQLGSHPDAVKFALPPALSDYVRYGASRTRAAA